jgi:hypothetical protein
MIEHLHDHIVSEIQQSARTDTVFVVTAVVFNLVELGINWGVAEAPYNEPEPVSDTVILFLLIGITIVINGLAIRGLAAGRTRLLALLKGLLAIYKDSNIGQYYDPAVLRSYKSRYNLFMGIVSSVGIAAIAVPLLEWTLGN